MWTRKIVKNKIFFPLFIFCPKVLKWIFKKWWRFVLVSPDRLKNLIYFLQNSKISTLDNFIRSEKRKKKYSIRFIYGERYNKENFVLMRARPTIFVSGESEKRIFLFWSCFRRKILRKMTRESRHLKICGFSDNVTEEFLLDHFRWWAFFF